MGGADTLGLSNRETGGAHGSGKKGMKGVKTKRNGQSHLYSATQIPEYLPFASIDGSTDPFDIAIRESGGLQEKVSKQNPTIPKKQLDHTTPLHHFPTTQPAPGPLASSQGSSASNMDKTNRRTAGEKKKKC